MNPPAVDIRVDLQAEDDTGLVWGFLRRAANAGVIQPGETVIAGDSGGRALAEVIDVVDGPTDKIVHLRLLDGSVSGFEARRSRLDRAV
jgi:hypothetical protein